MRTLYFIVGYTLLQFGIVTFLTNPLVSSSLTIINFLAVGGGAIVLSLHSSKIDFKSMQISINLSHWFINPVEITLCLRSLERYCLNTC